MFSVVRLIIFSALLIAGFSSDETVSTARPEQIKFKPFSGVTKDALSSASGTAFEGILSSPGAVVKIKDVYYLFYSDNVGGWPPSDIRIGYATSTDLKTWTRNPSVSLSGEHIPFLNGTTEHASVTSVLLEEDGTLVMYFDVFKNGVGKGVGRAIARSIDGPWKVDSKMVLKPGKDSWDKNGMASASVVKTEKGYRMYYGVFMDSGTNPEMGIGMAISGDGVEWTKHTDPVFSKGQTGEWDSHKVEVPRVVRVDDGWVMAYRSDSGDPSWGVDSGYGIATSQDGTTWSRVQSTATAHEDYVSTWATLWASAFFVENDVYYLLVETDGPPLRNGTRVNVLSFNGDFFK